MIMSSLKRIVLISGGNTGLGLETVKALASSDRRYEIIIGSRNPSSGQHAIQAVKSTSPNTLSTFSTLSLDLESDSSLEIAVQTITSAHGRLDVLINNGGIALDPSIVSGALSIRDGFSQTFNTNVIGPHILTTLAVPLLLKSSDPRLIFITSGQSCLAETEIEKYPSMARLNGPAPAGWPKEPNPGVLTTYRSSKTGLNMLMREWYRTLKNDGVKVWAVMPGFLATGLGGAGAEQMKMMGAVDASIGGQFVRSVVEGERDEDVGLIVRRDGALQPW